MPTEPCSYERSWHFLQNILQFSLCFPIWVVRVKVDEVGGHLVADVQVDDPVHQVEAKEGEGEEDAAPLVNVRRGDAHHLVELLRL